MSNSSKRKEGVIPLKGRKGLRHSPIRMTDRLEMEMQDIMVSIQSSGKLKKRMVRLMKTHSSLSKDFFKSILIAICF